MDKFDRFQQLHRLFVSRKKPVPMPVIAEKLECSESTAKRLVHQLRDYWQAPLQYSREANGWYYDSKHKDSFELPGLWLTAQELHGLATLLNLIQTMGEGLLNDELAVVEQRIHKLIQARGIDAQQLTQRIRYLPWAKRITDHHIFTGVAEALLTNKQITIAYRNYHNEASTRAVSPQTLVYYRENWYLDAWCHKKNELRTFSISRIERIRPERDKSKTIPPQQLADHFASSFGIFAGEAKHQARLRFYPEVARDIASQQWHPQQTGEWEGNCYLLSLPYNQDAELIMEILKYGNNVEVLAPAALRKKVKDRLRAALSMY